MDLAAIPALRSRRHLWKELAVEIERAARYHRPLSVTMYDVDHLGTYNERHGRDGGDEVLAEIATILIAQTRAVDIPAYYGGGAFILAVPETTKDQAYELAERVRRMVEFTFAPGRRSRHKVAITTSAGVSTYPDDGEDPTDLVRAAKRAVDAAKKAGRNLVVKTTEGGIEVLVPSAAGGMESVTIASPAVERKRGTAKKVKTKTTKPAKAKKVVRTKKVARKPPKKAKRVAWKAKAARKAKKVVGTKKIARKPARKVKTKRVTTAKKATRAAKAAKAAKKKRAAGKPAKKAPKEAKKLVRAAQPARKSPEKVKAKRAARKPAKKVKAKRVVWTKKAARARKPAKRGSSATRSPTARRRSR